MAGDPQAKATCGCLAVYFAFIGTCVAGVAYVAYHFISKWW